MRALVCLVVLLALSSCVFITRSIPRATICERLIEMERSTEYWDCKK